MLDADTSIGFVANVFTTIGVCCTPFIVTVAVWAPAGASIAAPPTALPVGGVVNSCTVSAWLLLPFTVILP